MINNIYFKLLKLAPVIVDPVLVTVTSTEGSTPQKPGSSAIFSNRGLVTGTVGGGVAEARTQEFALKCGRKKESQFFHYSFDNKSTDPEEAICGGSITILIDADPLAHLQVYNEMEKTVAARIPGVLITKVNLMDKSGVKIHRYWMTDKTIPDLHPSVFDKIMPLATEILNASGNDNYKKLELTLPDEKSLTVFLLEPVFPVPRLIIAGAGHIGKALSHLGKLIGFEVTVIDTRREFANIENLPDADHIIVKDIGQAMREINKSPDTFIVIVTRGHSYDAEALRPCIGTDAGYVGMIGSRAKVAKMHSDFVAKGWATEDQWKRISTPIGLEINSKTIQEIAVSIAAQLIMVKNSRGRKRFV